MSDIELAQGTDEWRAARCGSLGASQVADALAKIKSGWGASRANVMADLLAERLTGKPTETYVNAAMQRGTEKEPDARAAYEFRFNCDVAQVGLLRHPTLKGTHASPDGLVGVVGMVEFKAPNTATHIATLRGEPIAARYMTQCYWQLACAPGREWVDWCSFDDRLPESMSLVRKRIHRDDKIIAELESQVAEFLRDLDAMEAELRAKYEAQAAA